MKRAYSLICFEIEQLKLSLEKSACQLEGHVVKIPQGSRCVTHKPFSKPVSVEVHWGCFCYKQIYIDVTEVFLYLLVSLEFSVLGF